MIVDELHGILNAYEMRKEKNDPSRKEVAFKAIKDLKKSEAPSKKHPDISDDEESIFTKKLERELENIKENYP